MDKELIKQTFMDLADEIEKECGDWQNTPDTEENKKLRERIMAEVEKVNKTKKGSE